MTPCDMQDRKAGTARGHERPRGQFDEDPFKSGPWGKGFGDDFGDRIPRERGSRMGRGPGVGALDGEHRRRVRGKRMFGAGRLRLLLLELIGQQGRHGYELIKAVEELTGGRYAPSPGAVYPTLAMLADEGLIAEAARQIDGAKKPFALTGSEGPARKRGQEGGENPRKAESDGTGCPAREPADPPRCRQSAGRHAQPRGCRGFHRQDRAADRRYPRRCGGARRAPLIRASRSRHCRRPWHSVHLRYS